MESASKDVSAFHASRHAGVRELTCRAHAILRSAAPFSRPPHIIDRAKLTSADCLTAIDADYIGREPAHTYGVTSRLMRKDIRLDFKADRPLH